MSVRTCSHGGLTDILKVILVVYLIALYQRVFLIFLQNNFRREVPNMSVSVLVCWCRRLKSCLWSQLGIKCLNLQGADENCVAIYFIQSLTSQLCNTVIRVYCCRKQQKWNVKLTSFCSWWWFYHVQWLKHHQWNGSEGSKDLYLWFTCCRYEWMRMTTMHHSLHSAW